MEVRIPGRIRNGGGITGGGGGGGGGRGDSGSVSNKPAKLNLDINLDTKFSPRTKNFPLVAAVEEEEEEDEKQSAYQSSCTNLVTSDDLPPRAKPVEDSDSEEEDDSKSVPLVRASVVPQSSPPSSALRSLLNDLTDSIYRRVSGVDERTVLLRFDARNVGLSAKSKERYETLCKKFRMSFICWRSDCSILRKIFRSHGMEDEPNYMMMPSCNLIWTGGHVRVPKPLLRQQRINHFPRSHEMTRKDRLICNFQNMQRWKGYKHYNFLPTSFIYPRDKQEIFQEFSKWKKCTADKAGCLWIVKPLASSRGRGIYLISDMEELPIHDCVLVSRYISNPLLIDGVKFDLRIYVAVTSFDPLVAYIYEEGLTRFATVKYKKSMTNYSNHYMHLTNYSINKTSSGYVRCEKADVEDYGNKWTLSALLRYLRSVEGCDTKKLMVQIEDVIIKTLISVQPSVASGTKTYADFAENCFEIYGFDILVDADMKPWLLEVNMSPSLACDAPLDMKVKSQMLCDLMSLIGLPLYDIRRDRDEHKRVVAAKFAAERAAVYATSKISAADPDEINNNNGGNRHVDGMECDDKLRNRPSRARTNGEKGSSAGGDADDVVVSTGAGGDGDGGGSGGNGGGSNGAGSSRNGVLVEEVFSTDAIMRDLRKSYLAEKSKKPHDSRRNDGNLQAKNSNNNNNNHCDSDETLKVILNPHIRVSSATRSRMEKRMREREARRLSAAREKNGGAVRERPASVFIKRVVEEERRTGGWQRIFPDSDSWETYSYFMENGSSKKTMALNNFLWPGLKLKGRESRAPHADELADRKLRPPSVGEDEDFNFFVEASRNFKTRMRRYESSLEDCGLFQVEEGLGDDLDSETETIAWSKERHEMVRRKKTKKEMIRERRLSARREERSKEEIAFASFKAGEKYRATRSGNREMETDSEKQKNIGNLGDQKIATDDVNNNGGGEGETVAVSGTTATTTTTTAVATVDLPSRHRRSTSCVTLGGGGGGTVAGSSVSVSRGRRSLSIDKVTSKKSQRRELLEFARYQREELIILDGSRLKMKKDGGGTTTPTKMTTTTTTTMSEVTKLPRIDGGGGSGGEGKVDRVEDEKGLKERGGRGGDDDVVVDKGAGDEGIGPGNVLSAKSSSANEGSKGLGIKEMKSTTSTTTLAAATMTTKVTKDGEVGSRWFCSSVVAAIRSEEKSLNVIQARRAFGRFLVLLHARFDKALQQQQPQSLPQQNEHALMQRQQEEQQQEQNQPRESELKLVCTFLKRAAANFAYNFNFEIPASTLGKEERMRIIGEQLGKFVDIYLKESVVVIRNEKTSVQEKRVEAPSSAIRSKTFDAFLSMASEKEVEELLTYHARVKKSIDMFFGSPSEKKRTKDDEKDVHQPQLQEQQQQHRLHRSNPQQQGRQPQQLSSLRGESSANSSRGIIVKLPQPTLRQFPSQPPQVQTNRKFSTQDRFALPSDSLPLRRPTTFPQQTAM